MSGHRDLPLVSEWGGEFAVADQCAAQLQEREMQVGWPLVADAQPFVLLNQAKVRFTT